MAYRLHENIRFQLLDEILARLPYDGERLRDALKIDGQGGEIEITINQQYEYRRYTDVITLTMCCRIDGKWRRKWRRMRLVFGWKSTGFARWEAVRVEALDHDKILAKVAELDALLLESRNRAG